MQLPAPRSKLVRPDVRPWSSGFVHTPVKMDKATIDVAFLRPSYPEEMEMGIAAFECAKPDEHLVRMLVAQGQIDRTSGVVGARAIDFRSLYRVRLVPVGAGDDERKSAVVSELIQELDEGGHHLDNACVPTSELGCFKVPNSPLV